MKLKSLILKDEAWNSYVRRYYLGYNSPSTWCFPQIRLPCMCFLFLNLVQFLIFCFVVFFLCKSSKLVCLFFFVYVCFVSFKFSTNNNCLCNWFLNYMIFVCIQRMTSCSNGISIHLLIKKIKISTSLFLFAGLVEGDI